MKNKAFFLFLTLTTVLWLFACHKDKDDKDCPAGLHCATQEGANTFGCYIDGKPWVAQIGSNILDPTLHEIEANYDETDYRQYYNNNLRPTISLSAAACVFTYCQVPYYLPFRRSMCFHMLPRTLLSPFPLIFKVRLTSMIFCSGQSAP